MSSAINDVSDDDCNNPFENCDRSLCPEMAVMAGTMGVNLLQPTKGRYRWA